MVRDETGNTLDPECTSTVSLFRAHESASRSIDERIQEEKVNHRPMYFIFLLLYFYHYCFHCYCSSLFHFMLMMRVALFNGQDGIGVCVCAYTYVIVKSLRTPPLNIEFRCFYLTKC